MLEPNSVLQKRYRIIKQLGQGGMGAVYEAIDQRVKCTVVLKRTLFNREDLQRAFEREARLLANLRHPALPKVMDHFVEGEGQYLVMEHIPGQDLAQMLKVFGRPFAPIEVLRWADELLRVLEYLHGLNPPILHRDIKPSNLKLTGSGEVFLLDFGLAKGATGQMSTVGHGARSIAGYTPSYAPLEQILRSDSLQPDRHWVEVLSQINPVEVERILAAPTDERGDIYSLGATLYHLLTNEMPTHAGRRALYVWRNQPDPVRSVSELNPLVPVEVAEIVESAMGLGPDRRPPSAEAMRAALRDAGQSLRLHTGQATLHNLSREVLDDIARRVTEQLGKEQKGKPTASSRELTDFLTDMRNEIRQVGFDMLDMETRLRTKDEAHAGRLEELQEKVRNLEVGLDVVRQLTEDLLSHSEGTPKRVSPEEERRIVAAVLEALRRVRRDEGAQQPSPNERPTKGNPAKGKKRAKQDGQPTALTGHTIAAPGDSLTDMDFPVEAAEEAHRFARVLVSEIITYNGRKVLDGRDAGDLYDRLRADIDRLRQAYDKRVRPEVARRYDYFHHELVNTLAEGDPSRMGDDYPGPMLKK